MKNKEGIAAILILCVSVLGMPSLNAQPLNELLKEAGADNLELRIMEKEYLIALEKAPQVSELPDPEIGIGAYPSPIETRLGAQLARISASQMFPWFGTLESRAELEDSKAKVLHRAIDAERLTLFYDIKKAYFRLYQIEKSKELIRRNFSVFEALERLTLSKVEAGKGTMADVLRVRLEIEKLKQKLDVLEMAEVEPRSSINRLLNRASDTQIVFPDELLLAEIPFDAEALLENIPGNHPGLEVLALKREVSARALSLNDLNRKPSFGVGVDYIVLNEREDADPPANGRDVLQLRASVKIPLYRNKYDAKDREEKLKMAVLDDQRVDMLAKFEAMINTAYADYQTARLEWNYYDKQIVLIQKTISLLETDYSVRGSGFEDLLTLEKELVDYDLKKLKALVQSHMAKSSIERFVIR